MKLGLPLLLAALLLAAAAPATARRLQSLHRRQLAEGLDTCTGCLTQEPSKPLPLASDPLSAAAADLSFLVDPITFGISCEGKCTQEEQQQWLGNATAAAAKMGATATRLVYDPESQAAALIFNINNKIFVAFGGPQLFYDPDLLMTTAVMPMVETTLGSHQLPAGQRKVLVQGGMLKTANGVYKQLTKALAEVDPSGKKPVYFTGHSLGGALATLNAAMLHTWTTPSTTNNTVAAVYTFGSPRAGGAAWATAYRTMGLFNMTLRYVYNRDVVPLVPQDSTPGKAYDHVGRLIYITPCGYVTNCANETCGAYDYCAGKDVTKQKETCTAAATAMKKVCAADGVPLYLQSSLKTTTMKLLCSAATTLMVPNTTTALYDPPACCMYRTLAKMYLDPSANGDPIDYMQGFSNFYPGWASQCLPGMPQCEGTSKCPPGQPCNGGTPCQPGSPCSGIDETCNLRPPTCSWSCQPSTPTQPSFSSLPPLPTTLSTSASFSSLPSLPTALSPLSSLPTLPAALSSAPSLSSFSTLPSLSSSLASLSTVPSATSSLASLTPLTPTASLSSSLPSLPSLSSLSPSRRLDDLRHTQHGPQHGTCSQHGAQHGPWP
ncbi:hypothetical protein D9Q98_002684 [Chlorella vulgaris]|uniref:Fungal lipase-type domain-containing protein n=1 Tax=Chlorella vulgaris TaxID=3077 RepID=A0A9D4YZ33_CHLVU|nr:hypothetical protein D9Q98_002684 [Chlorella vulgaris]